MKLVRGMLLIVLSSALASLIRSNRFACRNRAGVVDLEGRWRGLLAQLIQQAIDLGHLRAGLDVDQVQWELCGIYLSHPSSPRFLRDAYSDRRAHGAFEPLVPQARRNPGKSPGPPAETQTTPGDVRLGLYNPRMRLQLKLVRNLRKALPIHAGPELKLLEMIAPHGNYWCWRGELNPHAG